MADTTTVTAPAPKRRRGWLRTLSWIVGVFIVLLVVAYFLGTSSAFFQGVILPRIGKSLHANITVSDVSISPFKEVVLHNLKVQTTGQEPLATAPEARARYRLMDIIGGNIYVDEVTLASPTISLVENTDGSSNLDPINQSQKEKSKEKKPARASKPTRIDLKKLVLSGATIRKVKNYPGGNRDVTELSNVNLTLDDLKNGQNGKLVFNADIKTENNPPAPGTNGVLQARLNGSFVFAMSADLRPASIKGNSHLEVTRAEGALAELATLGVDLDCDATPTEIKQAALRFQKGNTGLGELRVTGPFDMAKTEGRLTVEILSIDKQVLDLAGAKRGIHFGSTTLNSKSEIELAKSGSLITAAGQFNADKIQVIHANETPPPLDFHAQYDVIIDRGQQIADVRQFQITLTPTSRAKNELRLSGRVDLSHTNATQGSLKLDADSLDVTGYYDLFAGKTKTSGKRTGVSAPVQTTPLPAPAEANKEPEAKNLPFHNFTADVNIGHVYFREIEVTTLQTTAKIDGSHILLNPFKLALNGAPVIATLDLDLGVPGYKYDTSFSAQAVPLAPLMNSFAPERKGEIGGTMTAQAKVSGTGASLQKSLAGQFDITSTNLNLSVVNIKSPLLKTLINVISLIPELIRSRDVTSLIGGVTGAAGGGLADELKKAPVESINARGVAGFGRVDLQQAVVQSSAFRAEAVGAITLADVLTNSAVKIPVSVSLSQPILQRINLVPANTPANAPYAKLPDFLTLTGTVGKPKENLNKVALAGAALRGIAGAIPGGGGATGSLIQGLGGLLTGSAPASNSPSNVGTNKPTGRAGGVLQDLGGILSGSSQKNTNATPNAAANPPATNQSAVNELLDLFKKPKK